MIGFRSGRGIGHQVLWLAVMLTLTGVGKTQSDVLWLSGKSEPRYGRVINQTDGQVTFEPFENQAYGPPEIIPQTHVDQVVINFDPARLEKLTPGDPKAYRAYAEELAVQSADPTARDLARRLFLISAALPGGDQSSKPGIRDSSLAGLIALANSDDERNRLERLRLLISPASDQVTVATPSKRMSVSPTQSALTLELIQAIRTEDSNRAKTLLALPQNRSVFAKWDAFCSLDELDSIVQVNRPSKLQLTKVLRMEIQILSQDPTLPSVGSTDPQQANDWGDEAMLKLDTLGQIPSFDSVTEFDPGKSIFRDGRWISPAGGSRD